MSNATQLLPHKVTDGSTEKTVHSSGQPHFTLPELMHLNHSPPYSYLPETDQEKRERQRTLHRAVHNKAYKSSGTSVTGLDMDIQQAANTSKFKSGQEVISEVMERVKQNQACKAGKSTESFTYATKPMTRVSHQS